MKVPNVVATTTMEYLEKSLQNCCLNNESVAEEGITGRCSTAGTDRNKLQNGIISEKNSFLDDLKGEEATDDPKTVAEYGGGFYSDEDDDDDGDSLYDIDESSSESSPSSSRDNKNHHGIEEEDDNVLVVGGCKRCYMYFMVPKKNEGCPKCNGQLIRFDRSHITSPSP